MKSKSVKQWITTATGCLMIIYVTLLSSCGIKPGKHVQDARLDRIDSLLIRQSALQSNTGIAVGIVWKGEVIYDKGYGYANLATHDRATSKTMFHLGSIPKSFVAIALMQLVEQNKVNLDSSVIHYIPELKFRDERYKNITVRHLASHTSGIYTNRNHDWDNPKNEDDALDKFVRSLDYEALRFDPGSKFSYSDSNYDILGDIIYRVTGIPFEDYMKRYVLEPSGMHRSSFFLPDTDQVARPYIDDYENCRISRGFLYPVNREHAPSGTLFSNSTEMCNWMIMNINRGKFENNTVLNESSYDSLWNPVAKTGWDSKYYDLMGMGWFIGSFNGKTTYLHSGTDHGYRAVFCIIPEDKCGVVILSNYKETAVHYLLEGILSSLYGVEVTDHSSDLIEKSEYSKMTGQYSDTTGLVAQITQKGNLLYFTFQDETCCLSSVREGAILAGKYAGGFKLPFYYDPANVFLSRIKEDNGKLKYLITLGELVFQKN